MSRRRSSPDRVEGLFDGLLGRANRGQDWRPYRIWSFWDEVVGENIARRAQPERFRDGVLVVNVASHSWLQELQMLRRDIAEHLNARLGASLVHDISFVFGTVTPRPAAAVMGPTTETSEAHVVELPEITDPELAAAFASLNAARARRGRRASS